MSGIPEEFQLERCLTPAERKKLGRGGPRRHGYAYFPGTGPAGETCGSCLHIVRWDKFRKCELTRGKWTHGYGTDILSRSAACKYWEKAK